MNWQRFYAASNVYLCIIETLSFRTRCFPFFYPSVLILLKVPSYQLFLCLIIIALLRYLSCTHSQSVIIDKIYAHIADKNQTHARDVVERNKLANIARYLEPEHENNSDHPISETDLFYFDRLHWRWAISELSTYMQKLCASGETMSSLLTSNAINGSLVRWTTISLKNP